jgi:hypothetical protein
MARHYSSVIIQTPEVGEQPELVIYFDCDVCGKSEWRTHITHLGTLVRTLVDVLEKVGGDDGHTERFQHLEVGASTTQLDSLKARVRSATEAFKARRQR